MPLVDFSVFATFLAGAPPPLLASSAELASSDDVTFRLLIGIVCVCVRFGVLLSSLCEGIERGVGQLTLKLTLTLRGMRIHFGACLGIEDYFCGGFLLPA